MPRPRRVPHDTLRARAPGPASPHRVWLWPGLRCGKGRALGARAGPQEPDMGRGAVAPPPGPRHLCLHAPRRRGSHVLLAPQVGRSTSHPKTRRSPPGSGLCPRSPGLSCGRSHQRKDTWAASPREERVWLLDLDWRLRIRGLSHRAGCPVGCCWGHCGRDSGAAAFLHVRAEESVRRACWAPQLQAVLHPHGNGPRPQHTRSCCCFHLHTSPQRPRPPAVVPNAHATNSAPARTRGPTAVPDPRCTPSAKTFLKVPFSLKSTFH